MNTLPPIQSPCIGICTVDADGYCEGCLRKLDEIARWASMSDRERGFIMDQLLPAREAARA